MNGRIRITIWNEFRHEKDSGHEASRVYPQGIHAAITQALLKHPDFQVRTATLDEPEHGLTKEVLANTDVLTWWGHLAHSEVRDEVVERVHARVLAGMGLVVLHSGHLSKIFVRLMGTTCSLKWREHPNENARLWVIEPAHPIAQGLPDHVEIPHDEMYGERFDIPAPDELVFATWFKGGELFRSGCCFHRGNGKVFYFSHGHETFPVYHQPEIQVILVNACRWARPTINRTQKCVKSRELEKLG